MAKKNESLKPMVITDPENSKEYALEFNRKSVSKTEQAGFNISLIDTQSMTMIPLMFWGAFQMHHPYMTKEQTDKILFDGGKVLKEQTESPQTYTEIFEEACPQYMAMGMSYTEFWDGPPFLVVVYRKAFRIKREIENEQAWLKRS